MRILAAKCIALALIAMSANAVVTDPSRAQPAPTPPTFTKQALDASGAPLTGPVSVGQTIDYVLSYKPGTSPSGPVTIDDTLSPNLAYVNPSVFAPPGWSWNPVTPYSVGNHTQYRSSGFGPGTSFIVPVSDRAQVGQSGGDGTLPIPVGNRIYGLLHHLNAGAAKIMCWDLSSLIVCPPVSGIQWPLSIGSDLMTPTLLRHAVVGTKIYFPSARVSGSGTTAATTPGIGCWDTVTETPCPFIALPSGPVWAGAPPSGSPSGLDPLIGGIAADQSTLGRLFMYAANSASAPSTGRVYCVPLTTGSCAGWSSTTTLNATTGSTFADMILEETGGPSPTKLYVTHSANVTCLKLVDGTACSASWINIPTTSGRAFTLSPILNSTGSATTQVCLHSFNGGLPVCFDAGTGAPWTLAGPFLTAMTNMPSSTKHVFAAFRVPGKPQVLYPNGITSNATSPLCFDFSAASGAGAPCASFTPAWAAGNNFKDYGYATDPIDREQCLLGLGDAGIIWRFTQKGAYDLTGCVKRVDAKLDIDSFFCRIKPKRASWDSLVLRTPRPAELIGGKVDLVNSANIVVRTITIQLAPANIYPVNIPATGANSQLTLQFTPAYAQGALPKGYELELTFTADVDPQICYQATVTECGPVSNKATLTVGGRITEAGVNLGNATGPSCEPGLLKVCKVAGPGIAIGTPFNFTAGSSPLTVPAGPAPGGTCMIGPTFPVGSNVTVDEAVPPGYTVSSITAAPPNRMVGTPNLAAGSVNVTIGTGVTVVTFTDKLTGFLEICKRGEVRGNFSFTVSPGGLGPFVVPAGACSPPIEVIAGLVIVTEVPGAGSTMVSCATFPAGQQGPCDPNAQTSTVTVAAGDVSVETIAFITNRRQ